MYPFDPPIKQEVFSKKLQELVEAPTLPLAKWSLQSTDRLLQAKARELSADSARTFRNFIDNACTFRGAAIGHAIVKSGVRDSTLNYQAIDDADSREVGETIEIRQRARGNKCAMGKWRTHSTERHEDLESSLKLLRDARSKTPKPASHTIGGVRYTLRAMNPRSVQGATRYSSNGHYCPRKRCDF